MSDAVSVKQGPLTFAGAVRLFLSHGSPALLASVVTGCLVARFALGGFSWVDAVVCAGLLAFYPFQEWLIHVFILHSRPRKILGWTFHLDLAKKHKAHHEAPWDLGLTFIPWRTHAFTVAFVLAVVALVPAGARGPVLSGIATLWLMGVVYEWVHFVSHVPYRAGTRWMRELQRLHRLHHFKSEEHWHGVATHLADRVLGTFPDPASIEKTETCRTLA